MLVHEAHGEIRRAKGFLILVPVLLLGVACGGQSPDKRATTESRLDAALPVLNTFIADSIQIDQLDPGLTNPADANLFTGADPADGSPSVDFPAGGPGSYIDWNEIGGGVSNHVLYDFYAGKDPTAFPQSNECVGSAQVLSKMDLTYVAAANNTQYAYLAVQRSDNNGDAGYYWIFTRLSPQLIAGQGPCSATQQRLLYDISVGDVLIGGHFHPNGTPLLQVWTAAQAMTGVPATAAIDFTNSALWTPNANGVAAVAVNTTTSAPGLFGAQGVKAVDSNGNLQHETFAEAAVPVQVFTGSSVCGARFYGSVITRSSGAGGTNPDLKDLAGPALFNFGSASATAVLTPTCENAFGYQLTSFTGLDGQPATPASCAWTFSSGAGSSATCSGTVSGVSPGTYTGTLVATDAFGCSATVDTGSVNVFGPLAASASMTATCQLSFGYAGSFTGGSGAASYAWTFTGGGSPTPSTSSAQGGTVAVGTGGVPYAGHLVVTDQRTDIACSAAADASATPFAPLTVNLAVQAPVPACPSMSSDAVTYGSTASGGTGNYSYLWNGVGCAGPACVVDPAADAFCFGQVFTLTLGDDSGICPPVTSAPATYGKVTTITATAQ